MIDGYEPDTNSVYQFHGCHCHGYACVDNCKVRQKIIYKDTWKTDKPMANNGWDTRYNAVLIWGCEKPILKKERFEKEFMLILT